MTRIEVPPSSSRRGRGGRLLKPLILIALVAVGGLALWTWLTLSWSYSDGERAGVLQKFSRKGWICKTREGELAQYVVAGVSPQIWEFSVRDNAIAVQLDKEVGHRVQLHYTEHRGIPTSCFAETGYFVDRITEEPDAGQSPPSAVPPVSAAPAPSASAPTGGIKPPPPTAPAAGPAATGPAAPKPAPPTP